MSSRGRKIINVLLLVSVLAYTVVAVRYCTAREDQVSCRGVEIEIRDSATLTFVTPATVQQWLRDSSSVRPGIPLREVDVYGIERLVEGQDYVARAEAYTAIDGVLHVWLQQRRPVLRVVSDGGHNFYLDSTLVLLPPHPESFANVPVVSGPLPLGFSIGYFGRLDEKKFPRERELLHNLLNFVHQVDTDPFLTALVAQVWCDGAEVRLLPRVGRQTVRFGPVADSVTVAKRLRKLSRFYRSSFAEGWWRSASEIDLRFAGQVVCKDVVPAKTEKDVVPAKTETENPTQANVEKPAQINTESTHDTYGE